MRLGLIARADSRGLGIQTRAFHDQMHPAKTLVVNCPSAKPLPLRTDWYPDAAWTHGWPTERECRDFLRGLDVVYSAETFYRAEFPLWAREMGVKTVLAPNFELFDRKAPLPDLLAAPSTWRFTDLPDPKCLLRFPIETERFPQPQHTDGPLQVLHIVGRPAIHDRNGTADLLKALRYVTTKLAVTVRCQEPGYVHNLMQQHRIRLPANVTLRIATGDVENYWDMYTGYDLLVMPRRFGGLCLPCQEAIGAQIPVVMPDISPNDWLPPDWLVPATRAGSFWAKSLIDYYSVDHRALAAKIAQFADTEYLMKARCEAARLREELSWASLKPVYEQTFASV